MRKLNEENERIKRKYFHYLREANGHSEASVDKVAAALVSFEESIRYKPFKSFTTEQAVAFKRQLQKTKSPVTGKPLAKATVSSMLRALKAFFRWLSREPGYKSRIKPSDADYFNPSAKDEAIAHAHREKPFPSMEQASHAFRQMPEQTEIEQRDKAIFAFLMLTGARDGAIASLKLKHIDLIEGRVYQDPREVKTKASKTIYTTFFPVDPMFRTCFENWVIHLREKRLFSPDDPLFPKTEVRVGPSRRFSAMGVTSEHWSNADAIRRIVGGAFQAASLPRFGPHSFRKTLAQLGERTCQTPEEFKAWSQNLGHEHVLTTFMSYGNVGLQRQGEILKSFSITDYRPVD